MSAGGKEGGHYNYNLVPRALSPLPGTRLPKLGLPRFRFFSVRFGFNFWCRWSKANDKVNYYFNIFTCTRWWHLKLFTIMLENAVSLRCAIFYTNQSNFKKSRDWNLRIVPEVNCAKMQYRDTKKQTNRETKPKPSWLGATTDGPSNYKLVAL